MLNTAYKYQEFYDVMQMKAYNLTVNRADGTQTTLRLDSTDKYLTGEKEAPANVTVIGGKNRNHKQCRSMSRYYLAKCIWAAFLYLLY